MRFPWNHTAASEIASASVLDDSIWKSGVSPCDKDVKFEENDTDVRSSCFSPDCSRILVCLKDEVQIWSFETKQKMGHVPSSGCRDTSFSTDGRYIIVGDSKRTSIWDAASTEIVFDSAKASQQTMSFSAARKTIKTCGPSAHRMWPSSLRNYGAVLSTSERGSNATCITVDNYSDFIIYNYRPSFILFGEDVLVMTHKGVLVMFRLRQ